MIVDLPSSTVSDVNKALVRLRSEGGVQALGRVLTLVIVTDDGNAIEGAIAAGNSASREHPCRVIVLARGQKKAAARLDAQIRVGGDAGASDVIVLRGYGPLAADEAGRGHGHAAPAARRTGGRLVAGRCARGAVGGRRGQAGAAADHRRPVGEEPDEGVRAAPRELRRRRHRPHLDAAHAVAGAAGHGAGRPAARTGHRRGRGGRGGVAVDRPDGGLARGAAGGQGEALTVDVAGRASARCAWSGAGGAVELVRPDGKVGKLRQPGQPDRLVALARREVRDCLAEELRRLDPDEIYGAALAGIAKISRGRTPIAIPAANGAAA